MTDSMKEKREYLKSLSSIAAKMVEQGDAATVNDGLVLIYLKEGHRELNSFKKWKEKGFAVKRGEKALLLWGEPIKAAKQEREQNTDKDEFKFFPLAFVFSKKQVEPIVTKYHAT